MINYVDELQRKLLLTQGRLARVKKEAKELKKEVATLKEYSCPRCDLSLESGYEVWGGSRDA